MPLSVYTPFPEEGVQPVIPADLSEIFLKSYTVANGVSSITISDALFKLSQYKTIHVRFNNLTTTGATSSTLWGGSFKNDAVISGAYSSSWEAISSSTATGYSTSSLTPSSIANLGTLQISSGNLNFSSGFQQLDILITRSGMEYQFNLYDTGNNGRRASGTVVYPTPLPTTVNQNDYFGVIIGLGTGTFTGGTVSVFGVQ